MQISPEIIGTGLVMTSAGSLVYLLKDIPRMIFSKLKQQLIYRVVIYDYDELFYVLESWLYKNHLGKYRSVEASFNYNKEDQYLESKDKRSNRKTVFFKQDSNVFTIVYNGKRLFFSKSKEKLENAQTIRQAFSSSYIITGFKAKDQINKLLNEITEEYNSTMEDNRIGFHFYLWGSWEIAKRTVVKNLDSIIFNKEQKEALKKDLANFVDSQKWYNNVCIPYKRGVPALRTTWNR